MGHPAVKTAAAAAEVMALYDACWFRCCVLLPSPLPTLPQPVDADQQPEPMISSSSTSPTAGTRHRRTRSEEATTAAAAFQQGLEPLRVPTNRARLETILSGKDGVVVAAVLPPQPLPERARRPEARRPTAGARRPRRQRRGRSMSELEFEELKGLQDLGFTFSDAEVDAELASIVPGLRRKRSGDVEPMLLATTASAPAAAVAPPSSSARREEEASVTETAPRRPYLSEAWDDDEEELRAMLRNWRIPATVDGADLKEHIRMWAHTVASAVR